MSYDLDTHQYTQLGTIAIDQSMDMAMYPIEQLLQINEGDIQGIYYDAENIDGEISGSIKHRDLVSGEEQVIYSDINNPDIALSTLKTIALSDDLTAVLFQEVTHNSDTGMDAYSFRVLGVNKEGQVTSSLSESLGSHQMSDNSLIIDSVEVIDESQLLIIGSRHNDEMGDAEVFYGSYDFDLAEYVESGTISSIANNGDPATYALSNYMQVNAEAGFAVYIKPEQAMMDLVQVHITLFSVS